MTAASMVDSSCSSRRSSRSVSIRSLAPESAYSRSVKPPRRGGRWSWSATRAPFSQASSPPASSVSPISARSSVVLPAPFGPASASRSRRSTLKETLSNSGSPESSFRSEDAIRTAISLSVVAGYVCLVTADAKVQKLSIDTIRALAMDGVQKANAGHPGTAMALAPLAYVLYRNVMRHPPAQPSWPNRDRFVLSAGHAAMLQYALLHLTGYNLSLEELKRFRQWQSRTPGHPEHFVTEGVETTTGPLGQGFANGVGFAVADRFLAERYNRPHHELVDRWVYAICSDGDLMEGVSYEAASIAGHLGLGRLVYFYDDNHITIDGTTSLTFTTEDKVKRFEAQGWHVQSIVDAEDVDAIEAAIRAAQAEEDRPSLIIVRSHIAYGAPKAIDTSKSHGSPLGEDEVRAAKETLGLDPDKHFDVPDEVYEHMDARPAGIEAEQEWNDFFERWSEAFPKLREDWDADRTGKPRPGWIDALPRFPAGEDVATRDAGKKVMQAI